MMTFNYESIRDCKVLPLPKSFEGKIAKLKCCFAFSVDSKDAHNNKIEVCSNRVTPFKCNLEAKFMTEMITAKCYKHFNKGLDFIFHKSKNPRDFVMSIYKIIKQGYVSSNKNFVFSRILDYILNTTKKKIFSKKQNILLESKLQNLIKSLGRDFQEFLILNNISNNLITDILAKF